MKSVALGYKVVFMAKTCCQMIRNGNDSDWSGSGGGGGGADSAYKCTWSFYIGYHVANIV